ncbi:MAG: DUF6491 family protein [Thermoanaerobaculaceae bacterium]|nr:DUF6491 family protein [Thermoanaerobaculaceae bacterium]
MLLTRRTAARLLTASVLIPALACTSARGVKDGGRRAVAPDACFESSAIDSFSPVGERFVYLRALDGRQYLLTLDGVHANLPFATAITLSAGWSRVCSESGAMLAYQNLGRTVHCRILRVQAVANREAAERLAGSGATTKPEP